MVVYPEKTVIFLSIREFPILLDALSAKRGYYFLKAKSLPPDPLADFDRRNDKQSKADRHIIFQRADPLKAERTRQCRDVNDGGCEDK